MTTCDPVDDHMKGNAHDPDSDYCLVITPFQGQNPANGARDSDFSLLNSTSHLTDHDEWTSNCPAN